MKPAEYSRTSPATARLVLPGLAGTNHLVASQPDESSSSYSTHVVLILPGLVWVTQTAL